MGDGLQETLQVASVMGERRKSDGWWMQFIYVLSAEDLTERGAVYDGDVGDMKAWLIRYTGSDVT